MSNRRSAQGGLSEQDRFTLSVLGLVGIALVAGVAVKAVRSHAGLAWTWFAQALWPELAPWLKTLGLVSASVVVLVVVSRLYQRRRRSRQLRTVELILGRDDDAAPHEVIGALDSMYHQLRQRIAPLRWVVGQDHVVLVTRRDAAGVIRFYLIAPGRHVEALCGRLQSTYPNLTYEAATLQRCTWPYRYQMRLDRDPYTFTLKTQKDYTLSAVESLAAAWTRQPVGGEAELHLVLTPRPLSDARKLRRLQEAYQRKHLAVAYLDAVDPGIGYVEDKELKASLEQIGKGAYSVEVRIAGDTRELCKAATGALGELAGNNRLIEARIVLPGFIRLWHRWLNLRLPSLTDWLGVFQDCILATPHLAGMWHLPGVRLRGVDFNRSSIRRALASDQLPRGEDSAIVHDERGPVALPDSERRYGVLSLGLQGTGKSSDMLNGIRNDTRKYLKAGVVIDPKGDLAKDAVGHIPPETPLRILSFRDSRHLFAVNPFYNVTSPDVLISDAIAALRAGYDEGAIGPRSDSFLRNAMYAVLEAQGRQATFTSIYRMLADGQFRDQVAAQVTNPFQRLYWQTTFKAMAQNPKFLEEALSAPRNKLERLLSVAPINAVLNGPDPLDLADFLLRQRGWLIVDMAKADVGEDNVPVLANLLLAAIWQVLKTQMNVPPADRVQLALYADEVHNMANTSWITMLAEGRALGLEPWVAYQYRGQIKDPRVRGAFESLLQNILLHRTQDLDDAEYYAKVFMRVHSSLISLNDEVQDSITFGADDIMAIPNYQAVCRFMAGGEPQPAFLGRGLDPREHYRPEWAGQNEERTRVARSVDPAEASDWMASLSPSGDTSRPADLEEHTAEPEGGWEALAQKLERPGEGRKVEETATECGGTLADAEAAVQQMLDSSKYHPAGVTDPLRTFRAFVQRLVEGRIKDRGLDDDNPHLPGTPETRADVG